MQHSIYVLIDPRTNRVRYVGMSKQPFRRFGEHLVQEYDPKGCWIEELIQQEMLPKIEIIDRVATRELALKKEWEWVYHYVEKGEKLFNYEASKAEFLLQERNAEIDAYRSALCDL